MSTATSTLTDLEEKWENAEPGPFGENDAVIVRSLLIDSFELRSRAGYDGEAENIRIVERAEPEPEPKPLYVMASWVGAPDNREVYVEVVDGSWESITYSVYANDLVDPVPMVEMPSSQELCEALFAAYLEQDDDEWPGADALASAVLELLRGEA